MLRRLGVVRGEARMHPTAEPMRVPLSRRGDDAIRPAQRVGQATPRFNVDEENDLNANWLQDLPQQAPNEVSNDPSPERYRIGSPREYYEGEAGLTSRVSMPPVQSLYSYQWDPDLASDLSSSSDDETITGDGMLNEEAFREGLNAVLSSYMSGISGGARFGYRPTEVTPILPPTNMGELKFNRELVSAQRGAFNADIARRFDKDGVAV